MENAIGVTDETRENVLSDEGAFFNFVSGVIMRKERSTSSAIVAIYKLLISPLVEENKRLKAEVCCEKCPSRDEMPKQ